ncbi:hypothetical protein BDR26DRAFT_1006974 [Obelidium mucronatum]|nr:hypothetical protein BDR26DRAFT_1006974 [Obelidium mucronatum]
MQMQRRLYSVLRGSPVMLNILDPWLPGPVSLFSEAGRANLWQRVRRGLKHGATLYQLKKRRVALPQFKADAAAAYCAVNDAVARADKAALDSAASASFAAMLNPELKRIKRVGLGAWAAHGPVRVNIVNMVTAQAQGDPSKGDKAGLFCQITTKIASTQSYALYSHDKKLIGGDPEKRMDVVEYVVFERKLDADDGRLGIWKVAGKIATTKDPAEGDDQK